MALPWVGMTRSYGPLLFFLAAIWGASYLFIKVGVRDFSPAFFIEMRLVIGGLLLLAFLAVREGVRPHSPGSAAPGARD